MVLAGVLALGTVSRDLGGLGGDNAQYILLAKSIAAGQGYRTLQEPGGPPHTAYPFGFPLILAPIVALWGTHAFLAMHLWIVAWSFGCLWLLARWARSEILPWIGRASIVLTATSPLWMQMCGQILSEFPYLFFSAGALLAARKLERTGRGWTLLWGCLLSAVFIRTAGWALILGVGAWCMVRRMSRRPAMGLAIGLLIPVLAWQLRNAWATRSAGIHYVGLFGLADPYDPDRGALTLVLLVQRILGNFAYYVRALGEELVWPVWLAPPGWVAAVGGALSALIAAGFLRRAVSFSAVEGYLLFYALMILLWPFQEGRFLFPVLPFLWLYLLEGARWLAKSRWKILGRRGLIGLWTANFAGVLWVVGVNGSGITCPPVSRGYLAAHDWVRSNTPDQAVLLSRQPAVTALLADRHAVGFPFTEDSDRLIASLDRSGVTHVVVDGLFRETHRYLLPALRRHAGRFEPEAQVFSPAFVLQVRPRKAG